MKSTTSTCESVPTPYSIHSVASRLALPFCLQNNVARCDVHQFPHKLGVHFPGIHKLRLDLSEQQHWRNMRRFGLDRLVRLDHLRGNSKRKLMQDIRAHLKPSRSFYHHNLLRVLFKYIFIPYFIASDCTQSSGGHVSFHNVGRNIGSFERGTQIYIPNYHDKILKYRLEKSSNRCALATDHGPVDLLDRHGHAAAVVLHDDTSRRHRRDRYI